MSPQVHLNQNWITSACLLRSARSAPGESEFCHGALDPPASRNLGRNMCIPGDQSQGKQVRSIFRISTIPPVFLAVISEHFNFVYRVLNIGRFSVLVFGPKSVSYERSRSINRCILRVISARACWQFPKISQNDKKDGKIQFWTFWKIAKFKKNIYSLAIQSPTGYNM